MCKSKEDGGQRCAAHTRPAYENTPLDDPSWDENAAQYASTKEGRARLIERATQAAADGDFDTEARLRQAIIRGSDIRDANADMSALSKPVDLTTWEPTDIDGELASLYQQRYQAEARRESQYAFTAKEIARHVYGRGWRETANQREVAEAIEDIRNTPAAERTYHQRELLEHHERVEALNHELASIASQMKPYDREFARRGGWTRAFLVSNGNGHVHKDMNCSTCRPTTQYHWVTELSGHDESEVVDAAGERACTCCYPSAPAEVRERATRLFTPDEVEQQQAREARAEAARQRDAAKIAKALTPDGSPFKVECTRNGYPSRERFATERAATTWMVSNMADYQGWMRDRTMDDSMREAHEDIITAIAEKHSKPVEEVRADIEKKVQAKVRRDARG